MLEKLKAFFREVKVELTKVVFPSREEVIGSTWVVIIASVVVAGLLGTVDIVLSKLVGFALK